MPSITTNRMLTGRNAILTGAAGGLGQALAAAFWQAGASLLLVDLSAEGLAALRDTLAASAQAGQSLSLLPIDLRQPGAPERIIEEARRLWPQLHALVNNAGIIGPVGPADGNAWPEWQDCIHLNLLTPVRLSQLAIGWMREAGSGSIVNLSGGGATSPRPNFSAYATAKCGLVRFTETAAAELKDTAIRLNAIAPGIMNTGLLRTTLEAGRDRVGDNEYLRIQQAMAGQASDPAQPAALAVYLASDAAAAISGRLISAVWDPWPSLHEHAAELAASDIYTLRRIVPEERGKDWSHA